jgi:alcohol dehydrogenase
VEFAKLSGARTIVMDTNERRLGFVREAMGVPDTLLAGDASANVKALAELGGGNLPQVVVDATGSHHSMSAALQYLSFAGRLVFVGVTQDEVRFGHPLMHRRELTLLASRNALSPDFSQIVSLIEEGKIRTDTWITHHASLGEVPEVFAHWMNPENGVLKAVVSVGGN